MENKRKYKIVASDLDGTLLGEDQLVSPENLRAISEMKRLGVEFIPATGRTLGEITREIIYSDDIRYVLASNGAIVWDKLDRKMIISHYMPKHLLDFMIELEHRYTTYTIVHDNGKAYYDSTRHRTEIFDACHLNDYYRKLIGATSSSLSDYDNVVANSETIEMFCTFFANDDDLREAKKLLLGTGMLSAVETVSNCLEIYLNVAGKGNTLTALSQKLGVDTAEVIAVGDSANDYTLLKASGLGLAMGNACPALKEIADETICNNSEHGAKYILENFINQ